MEMSHLFSFLCDFAMKREFRVMVYLQKTDHERLHVPPKIH